MKRYKKIVLKAEDGITFENSVGRRGELIIRALKSSIKDIYWKLPSVSAGEYAEVLSAYTDIDGNKVVVPQGWTVSGVSKENITWRKDNGVVIYHIPEEKASGINWKNPDVLETLMKTYDQFVWTPVGLLTANSTLDEIHFKEKFGRMKYIRKFSKSEYHEPLVGELLLQKESVDKYDGYYSSRYNISKDEETGKPRSVKGVYSWRSVDFLTAKEVASTMIESETLTTHLMYGAEYDTREKWAIETGAVTREELVEDSTKLGNYCDNKDYPYGILKTGEEGCINNIYGFVGNVGEWTQEQYGSPHSNIYRSNFTIRGGNYGDSGRTGPAHGRYYDEAACRYAFIGFRVTMCIK